jgi:tellurite resistance protein
MDSLQRVFDLPYGDTQRDIDTQVKIRESIRDRFALCRREYQVLQNSAKSSAKAKLLTWLGDTVGDDSRLEAALIETTQLVQRVKWAKSSECMKEIRSLIKESELWSLRCEILLRWVPVRPSLSDALKLQESPKWTAEQAFVNAMCAVAAADGDFCVDEKRAVVRIAKRVGIATDDEAVSIVIESVKTWLQVARKEGLTVMLARSVRGIVNIEDQTLRNKLRKALQFIADADGTREQREDAILKLMQPYL